MLRVMAVLQGGKTFHYIPALFSYLWCVYSRPHVLEFSMCHRSAACRSKLDPTNGAPYPTSLLHLPFLSQPRVCSVLTAWLTPFFPLSAPRYNATCHRGPFCLGWDPGAICPVLSVKGYLVQEEIAFLTLNAQLLQFYFKK